ncbi:MAG: DUF5058 family protein [Clostridia bacterium]|nr:DUF5058 family protein [Clostridia bacterium]
MNFSINSPILFALAGFIVLCVFLQSVYFLIMAYRRAKELNMDMTKVKGVIKGAAVFTVVPAISIVIAVITLSKDLGLPLPWLRLSVVGNLSYETIAASNAESAMGLVFGKVANLTAQQYATIALVMTISILVGIWLLPLVSKRLLSGVEKIEKRDKVWGDLLQNSLFIGMIAAFLGFVFCDFGLIFHGDTSGLIPVFVFFTSAAVMAVAGILLKVTKIRAITDYALPVSMIVGMAMAIPLTHWLG